MSHYGYMADYGSLDRAAQEMHDMERGIASMERQYDRLQEENYSLRGEVAQLKAYVQELEGSLLNCARCGRGIGEDDDDV